MRVRAAGRFLLRRLRNRRGFLPDWRDREFVESLSSRSRGFSDFWRGRKGLAPHQTAALYFRERETPRLFVDPGDVLSLVSTVESEYPPWKERTVRLVRQECREGLSVYSRRGPVLGRNFPWGGVEPGPGGDKLYRKRPHRFAFAPRLALAALYGERSDEVLRDVLLSWMEFASSTENGLAYDSNLAVIERTLALSWAWTFLAARDDPKGDALALEGMLLHVLHEDAKFLAPRLGHSHANNHMLADGFGAWFLGLVWPEIAESELFRERFEPLWLRELERQTLADGTSFEHSTHYHEYACEMATAYVILSRRNSLPVPDWVLERTRRLLRFQAALATERDGTVEIGDSAEDPLFPLDCGNGWGTAAWPELLRGLFHEEVSEAENDPPSRERAFWLLGGFPARPVAVAKPRSVMESFPQGGYYVFRDARSTLVFRTGPSSREALSPGHMHADFMSVYLTALGIPLIVDAGTYTYRSKSDGWPDGEPDWRGYLTGPSAHNALAIEGRDPLGRFHGDFRKRLESFVTTEKVANDPLASWVDAVMEGEGAYAGYRRGVIQVPGEYRIVYDILQATSAAERRSLGFQFDSECTIGAVREEVFEIRRRGASLLLTASAGLHSPRVVSGSREPLGGWVSRVYGDLAAAPQVRFGVAASASAFLLRIPTERGPDEKSAIAIQDLGGNGVRLVATMGDVEDFLFVNWMSRDAEPDPRNLSFQGDLARVRRRAGRLECVHWLNGRSLVLPEVGLLVESRETIASLRLDGDDVRSRSALSPMLKISWPT